MTVVLAWSRYFLRRQWRSLIVLALLVGLSGAVVMAAVAGARRGSSAVDRALAVTLPATVAVLPNEPGFDWDVVRALPEVEGVAEFVVNYGISVEAGGQPVENLNFPMVSPEFLDTTERPVVFAGRAPTAWNEVFVTQSFEEVYGAGVGGTVRVTLPTPDEVALGEFDPAGAAERPTFQATIVGVGETPWLSEVPGRTAGLTLAPALADRYPANLFGAPAPDSIAFVNALVRLRHGAADVASFAEGLERASGRADIEFMRLYEDAALYDRQAEFEGRWLLAFAAAALLAATFLVGQAVARSAGANAADLRIGRALGLTDRQALAAAVGGPAAAGATGAVLAVGGALAASRWMPIGSAGYVEPDPGLSADWLVLLVGGAVVAAAAAAGGALAARRALTRRRAAHPRGSRLATTAGRSGLGTPVEVGVRFALEPGRGDSAVPVRPALLGAVVGVLGVIAAFSFARGVDEASSNPVRFGQVADFNTFVGLNGTSDVSDETIETYVHTLRGFPEVAAASDVRTQTATFASTGTTAAMWTLEPSAGEVGAVVVEGYLPETPDDVALGLDTLEAIGASVGDTVDFSGQGGTRRFTVSGAALVTVGPHNDYSEGGYVTPEGFERLFDEYKYRLVFVDVVDGLALDEAADAIRAQLNRADPEFADAYFEPVGLPPQARMLAEVRGLPLALAAFLTVLALAAVGYSLAAAVRRRAGDLAMMRALGMTRRQTRVVIATQATVLALAGLVVGVPVGLMTGLRVWQSIADFMPFQYVTPWAVWALVLVGPAALLAANVLAALPGRRATRLAVAHMLRAE